MAQVKPVLAALGLLLLARPALADPLEDAQRRKLEELRSDIAGQVHLTALDMVDELVLGWKTEPVFAEATPVVLASVTVPVGMGAGMEALVENHLAEVLSANPATNVQLVHCPSCTSVVVHSGPEATVVSRGIDNPDALAQLEDTATQGQHALYVDIEAEGAFLVLRARLTRLTAQRPIVWSHTIASSTSVPSMLRAPQQLMTADEARDAYLDALQGRGEVRVPLRVVVRTYAQPPDQAAVAPPPFLWFQSGAELALTRGAGWTGSLIGGFSFIPDAYMGIMGQARASRLITGRVRSHSRPDVYAFFGASVTNVWGPGTEPFSGQVLTGDDILTNQNEDIINRDTFGTLQGGLDVRVGSRMGMSAYFEHMPSMRENPNMGAYVTILNVPFQSFGTEVAFWF
jgi:hypothetical protein